jgi:hypothetical protein
MIFSATILSPATPKHRLTETPNMGRFCTWDVFAWDVFAWDVFAWDVFAWDVFASCKKLRINALCPAGTFWGTFLLIAHTARRKYFPALFTLNFARISLPGCRISLPGCRVSSLRTLGKYELLPGCRLAGRPTHTHEKNISGSSAQFLPPQRTPSARGLRPYDLTTLRSPYDLLTISGPHKSLGLTGLLTTLRPYDLANAHTPKNIFCSVLGHATRPAHRRPRRPRRPRRFKNRPHKKFFPRRDAPSAPRQPAGWPGGPSKQIKANQRKSKEIKPEFSPLAMSAMLGDPRGSRWTRGGHFGFDLWFDPSKTVLRK